MLYYNFELTQLLCDCRQDVQWGSSERQAEEMRRDEGDQANTGESAWCLIIYLANNPIGGWRIHPSPPSHLPSALLSALFLCTCLVSCSSPRYGSSLIAHFTTFLSSYSNLTHFPYVIISAGHSDLAQFVGADLDMKQWCGVAASVGDCEPMVRIWFMISEASTGCKKSMVFEGKIAFILISPFYFSLTFITQPPMPFSGEIE